MFGNYSPSIKYVSFHFLYDSSDLLTKSKVLAFLNIPRWLGLMGFQNKWIGFLNLSKYRAQGLSLDLRGRLWVQIPSLPSEQQSRGPDYQQPVIFDGNRGHRNQGGSLEVSRTSPWCCLDNQGSWCPGLSHSGENLGQFSLRYDPKLLITL